MAPTFLSVLENFHVKNYNYQCMHFLHFDNQLRNHSDNFQVNLRSYPYRV